MGQGGVGGKREIDRGPGKRLESAVLRCLGMVGTREGVEMEGRDYFMSVQTLYHSFVCLHIWHCTTKIYDPYLPRVSLYRK